jgi:hypothetical protein
MGNPNHNPANGQFTSRGAADGDHQASATPPRTPRMAVTAHNGAPSVGTGKFRVNVKPKGPKLSTEPQGLSLGRAARERKALNESLDRRAYPNDSADIAARFKARATGSR